MEKNKTLKKVLIIVVANLLMLVFGVSAFFTIIFVRDYMSEKAVGTSLEDMGVRYESIGVFPARDDVLCGVVVEDGRYSLYRVEGDNGDVQLRLLRENMQSGEKHPVQSREGEYAYVISVYENETDVPSNAYDTAEIKTENTTVYFCVEYFILGDITDMYD